MPVIGVGYTLEHYQYVPIVIVGGVTYSFDSTTSKFDEDVLTWDKV